jgi:DNA-binding transcriptional LysR family regulator
VCDLRRDELIPAADCLREQTLELWEQRHAKNHAPPAPVGEAVVQARTGCAVVPGIAATAPREPAGFRFHRFAPPAPSRTIGLAFSPDHPRANGARAMAEFLQGLAATG